MSTVKFMQPEVYLSFEGQCYYNEYEGFTTVRYIYLGQKGTKTKSVMEMISGRGPVNMLVAGNNDVFLQYESGIISEKSYCPSDDADLDHFVVAVGYGKDEETGMTYYIIKNSFGTSWGETGYVRI